MRLFKAKCKWPQREIRIWKKRCLLNWPIRMQHSIPSQYLTTRLGRERSLGVGKRLKYIYHISIGQCKWHVGPIKFFVISCLLPFNKMEALYGLPFHILEVPNLKLRKPGWVKPPSAMVVFAFVLLSYFLVTGGKGSNNFHLIVSANSTIICILWLAFDCINANLTYKFWFFVMSSSKYSYPKFCSFDNLIYYCRGHIEVDSGEQDKRSLHQCYLQCCFHWLRG